MKSTKVQSRLRRKKRIRARISGSNERPRLVVSRSNKHISAQLVDDATGVTLASANDMKEKNGNKMESAQSVGTKIAEAAKAKKISKCVFDRSGYRYHGRVKALAEAAREAGLEF